MEWLWSEADGRETAAGDLRRLRERHPGRRSVLERSSSATRSREDLLFDISVY